MAREEAPIPYHHSKSHCSLRCHMLCSLILSSLFSGVIAPAGAGNAVILPELPQQESVSTTLRVRTVFRVSLGKTSSPALPVNAYLLARPGRNFTT
jgi:hypothetical protein